MHEIELLHAIRSAWLQRVTHALTRGMTLRDDLREEMDRLFSLLEQVMQTGDPSWLNPLLQGWSEVMTSTDLESGASSLVEFVRTINATMLETCRESLAEGDALTLISALYPHLETMLVQSANYETQAKITYITNQLNAARQALERLDRSKSDFISVAAHELRTPLTLVEGYAAMLRESWEKKASAEMDRMLIDGIHNGTRRLQALIDDMIDVSLLDNNLLSLNFQPVWINRLFSILHTEFSAVLRDRSLTLEIRDFPGSSEMTFADPERLLQVFRNILSNSVKYTPDGGTIIIEGRKLPGFIETTITDTGIGIAPSDMSIIFETFSRLGNAALHSSGKTKFKGGGPGLGLRIARGIIESHGGAIWVESPGYDEKECPGSTFHVLLPVRQEPPDSRAARLFASLIAETHTSNGEIN